MRKFIDKIMNRTKRFTVLDFAVLKTCLLSIGLLVGAYYAEFFLRYTMALLIIFIVTYVWIIYCTFIRYRE